MRVGDANDRCSWTTLVARRATKVAFPHGTDQRRVTSAAGRCGPPLTVALVSLRPQ